MDTAIAETYTVMHTTGITSECEDFNSHVYSLEERENYNFDGF